MQSLVKVQNLHGWTMWRALVASLGFKIVPTEGGA